MGLPLTGATGLSIQVGKPLTAAYERDAGTGAIDVDVRQAIGREIFGGEEVRAFHAIYTGPISVMAHPTAIVPRALDHGDHVVGYIGHRRERCVGSSRTDHRAAYRRREKYRSHGVCHKNQRWGGMQGLRPRTHKRLKLG